MISIVNGKGQIIIPAAIVRQLKIKPGTRLHVEVDETNLRLIVTPITPEYVRSLRGSLMGKGALKLLEAERRQERER